MSEDIKKWHVSSVRQGMENAAVLQKGPVSPLKKYGGYVCGVGVLISLFFLFSSGPVKAFFLSAQADHAVERQNWDKAVDCYQRLIQSNPKNADYYFDLGYVYLQKRDFEKLNGVIGDLEGMGESALAKELKQYTHKYKKTGG